MIDWLRAERQAPAIDIGDRTLPIAIRRHARARRLTMRLAPDGSEVRITLPTWGRTLDALAFAKARAGWIANQLQQVPERLAIGNGGVMRYRGEPLQIEWRAKAPRTPAVAGTSLLVGGPQASLDRRIGRWLDTEALRLMEQDLAFYCARAGLAPPHLKLSRAQRRWGSCSSERDGLRCVRVNWRLVMAPDHVRRSVVAHEVAHLVHFDHSPAFHALLAELYEGEIAAADAWLRAEGRSLYAAFG